MKDKIKLLVVDDDNGHRITLLTLLNDWGYSATGAASGEAAILLCREQPFDLVLMDVRMSGISGLEALEEIKVYNPAIPVIIMTAYSDVENAVRAIKSGAYDYLTKPLDFDDLKLTLERATDHASLRRENSNLKNALAASLSTPGQNGLLGQSEPMRRLLEMIGTIAPSEATVLITGESGTGKELAAKMIHAGSSRAGGPYVAVNCAALSENLLESELFGHEKGAFTGAEKRRDGRFLAADKGTIFLDEIGEIPLSMQAKLLRAIQEREIQRVGGDKPIKADVRILAATNKDLQTEVDKGNFRQDLYYRLNVVAIQLPPLRERPEDIPILAAHFLQNFAEKNRKTVKGFTPGAMNRLIKHAWPGNVRELENTVERAVVLLLGEYISERELPPGLQAAYDNTPAAGADAAAQAAGVGSLFADPSLTNLTLEEIERAVVAEALENVGGNKSEAARRLGITRKTLLAKLQEK